MNRQLELLERLKPQASPAPNSLAAMEQPKPPAPPREAGKSVGIWILAGQLDAFDKWRYANHLSHANAIRIVLKDFPDAPPSFTPQKGGQPTVQAPKIPPTWYKANGYVRTTIHMYTEDHRKFSYMWRTHKISQTRLMQELLQMQLFSGALP